jgi:hydroxymethylbilane synthase
VLDPDLLLPAPGQGALGVQCRADGPWLELLEAIDDRPSRTATAAERAFLAGLGGGCALPIAAYAQVEDGRLRLLGRVTAPDGSAQIDVNESVALRGDSGPAAAERLGSDLAGAALARGAAALLSGAKTEVRV